jgi:VanZ family protein
MAARPRIAAGALSLLIYLGIFLFSSLPAASLPSTVPDFIPHFLEFFTLAFFFIQVFPAPRSRFSLVAALLALAGLGLLDELHQLAVPGRICSLLDWFYDTAGALAGLAAFVILEKRLTGKNGKGIARRLKFLILER